MHLDSQWWHILRLLSFREYLGVNSLEVVSSWNKLDQISIARKMPVWHIFILLWVQHKDIVMKISIKWKNKKYKIKCFQKGIVDCYKLRVNHDYLNYLFELYWHVLIVPRKGKHWHFSLIMNSHDICLLILKVRNWNAELSIFTLYYR